MSIEDTTETMVNLIPVVVTADIVTKFADRLSPGQQQPQPRKKQKKDVYSRSYSGGFGNFSNVGF